MSSIAASFRRIMSIVYEYQSALPALMAARRSVGPEAAYMYPPPPTLDDAARGMSDGPAVVRQMFQKGRKSDLLLNYHQAYQLSHSIIGFRHRKMPAPEIGDGREHCHQYSQGSKSVVTKRSASVIIQRRAPSRIV